MYPNLDAIRLAAVPLSLTLLSILSGSVINRVMVVELGLPVIVAGLFVAIPLLVSPARVWLGYLSDAYPIRGRRREPYLVLGAFLSGAGVFVSVALVVKTPEPWSLATVVILLALGLFGLGRNLTGNTFQALVADRFAPGVPRSRAVNLYEVVKLVGMVMTAGLVGLALRPYSAERLVIVVAVVCGLALVLSVMAAWNQEPRTQAHREAAGPDGRLHQHPERRSAARRLGCWPPVRARTGQPSRRRVGGSDEPGHGAPDPAGLRHGLRGGSRVAGLGAAGLPEAAHRVSPHDDPMMKVVSRTPVAVMAILPFSGLLAADAAMSDTRLLGDDHCDAGLSAVANRWASLADCVMGGRSGMEMGHRNSERPVRCAVSARSCFGV